MTDLKTTRRAWWLTLLSLWLSCGWVVGGDARLPNEYKLKAVYLFNFTKFVDWPAHAFASTNAPLIIGLAIPVLMVAFIAASIYIPRLAAKPKSAAERAVWAAWNALPEGEESPVKHIASKLSMTPADVAFIVYPAETFGRWDDSQEPDLP